MLEYRRITNLICEQTYLSKQKQQHPRLMEIASDFGVFSITGESEGGDPALLHRRRPPAPDGVNRGVRDSLAEAGGDPGADEERSVHLGQRRSENGEDGGGGDAVQKDPLAAVLGGEVSARDLGDHVAVEEAGEDETLGARVPRKVGKLQKHRVVKQCVVCPVC